MPIWPRGASFTRLIHALCDSPKGHRPVWGFIASSFSHDFLVSCPSTRKDPDTRKDCNRRLGVHWLSVPHNIFTLPCRSRGRMMVALKRDRPGRKGEGVDFDEVVALNSSRELSILWWTRGELSTYTILNRRWINMKNGI